MNESKTALRILFGTNGWPCGVLDLGSWLKSHGNHDIRIAPVLPDDSDPLGRNFALILKQFKPHFLGFRLEGGFFEQVCIQIESAKKISDANIILGGPAVGGFPERILEESGADYVFTGEAEVSLASFLHDYSFGNEPISRVIRSGPVSEEILRENRLDFSLLESYDTIEKPFESLFFTSSRGCPGKCVFCAKQHGAITRCKSPEQLLKEIEDADRLVQSGKVHLGKWPLFEHVYGNFVQKSLPVSWVSVYDEDFFLDKKRAAEFLRIWRGSPLRKKYRLGFQTNPKSLLAPNGEMDGLLWYWFDLLKPMIQLGAESFYEHFLERWKKRHDKRQLETVLNALDRTGMDYTVFHIQADYETNLRELLESNLSLLNAVKKHPKMRVASSPLMIPLFGTEIYRNLEESGRLKISHFTELDEPHPEWLDPDLAETIDKFDEVLQWLLYPQKRKEGISGLESLLNNVLNIANRYQ